MADPSNKIQFFQACLPPLLVGDYRVKIEQKLEGVEDYKTLSAELEFSVAGPRFTLNPSDVYAVYPPANQSGAFGDTLPHIVFTRRTLPWERTVDGGQPNNTHPCPWLALLVCSEADFIAEGQSSPRIRTRKVRELLEPEQVDQAQGPDLKLIDLKEYESTDDLCNTIDLPAGLFSQIVPAKADLPYLAHVRKVHTGDKETLSLKTEGCFSVVLANRFPEAAAAGKTGENTAYLVSLEGFEKYLYGASATLKAPKIRMAVLASWSFFCRGASTFKEIMENLDFGTLKLPSRRVAQKADAAAATKVQTAFDQGYVALDHHIRNGENTISWYRGPLLPVLYDKLPAYRHLPCPDAALRYNYETGLLDTTYAAAWQLGRLLALQNMHFGRAMYRYRNQERQKAKIAIRKKEIDAKYDISGRQADERLLTTIRKHKGKLFR